MESLFLIRINNIYEKKNSRFIDFIDSGFNRK